MGSSFLRSSLETHRSPVRLLVLAGPRGQHGHAAALAVGDADLPLGARARRRRPGAGRWAPTRGTRSCRVPCVIWRTARVASSRTAISKPPSMRAVYAISRYCLFGFQAGASFQLPIVVSAAHVQPLGCPSRRSAACPLRSDVKAISWPVGLQKGAVSRPGRRGQLARAAAVGVRDPDLHVAAAAARVRDALAVGAERRREGLARRRS